VRTLTILAFSITLARFVPAQTLPEGPGKEVFANVCSACHGLDIITSQKQNAAAWKAAVNDMKSRGASATDAEFESIVNYLAKNFGTGDDAAHAPANAPAMPEGPGKQLILAQCTGCHPPDQFTKYRHAPEEWQVIITRMGTRLPSASRQDLDAIEKYFEVNFPKVTAPEDANKVNVNKAGAPEIQSRLDFTAAEAEAIVKYRETHGDFKDWRDMLIIYGVNGRKVQAAQDRMSF